METIKDRLQTQVDAWQQLGHPAIMERFVLRNGRPYDPIAFKGRKGTPKECFSNAIKRWDKYPDGLYVEGYAYRPSLGLPIHHGWLGLPGDKALDVTLKDPTTCQYFGVPFTRGEWGDAASETGYYGMLDTPFGINVPFIFRRDPELRDLLTRINPDWKFKLKGDGEWPIKHQS